MLHIAPATLSRAIYFKETLTSSDFWGTSSHIPANNHHIHFLVMMSALSKEHMLSIQEEPFPPW